MVRTVSDGKVYILIMQSVICEKLKIQKINGWKIMAMSLKKIGAIAVGGAMVASALASGAMAATTSGDVAGFMKDTVKDGQPNVDIVVGSNAAAMDVVSAADIAAKIGAMCYKDAVVEDGKATVQVVASAETNADTYNLTQSSMTMFAIPNNDYNDLDTISVGCSVCTSGLTNITDNNACGNNDELSTLAVVKDADPDDLVCGFEGDAIELLFARMYENDTCKGEASVDKTGYASVITQDGKFNVSDVFMAPAMFIPFLGDEYMVVDIDTDDNAITLGKAIYKGNINEGDSKAFGNGYEVKVANMYETGNGKIMVTLQLLKDGQVVAEKTDIVSAPCCSCPGTVCNNQITLTDGKMGVIAVNSYKNIAGTAGSVRVYVADNLKTLELGENYDSHFKIYGVVPANNDNTSIVITSKTDIESSLENKNLTGVVYSYTQYNISGKPLIGIALVREDDVDDMSEDSKASFLNYYKIKADNLVQFINSSGTLEWSTLDFSFAMDVSKELKLTVGDSKTVMGTDVKLKAIDATAHKVVPVKAPVAKLDTEVSLDTADKNLILVGGPVVNALTKELQDAGKIAIDNESPAKLAVVEGAANNHDVLVVAGGNREATREAALDLIENY